MIIDCVRCGLSSAFITTGGRGQQLAQDPVGHPLWEGLEDDRHLGVHPDHVSRAGVAAEQRVHVGVHNVGEAIADHLVDLANSCQA